MPAVRDVMSSSFQIVREWDASPEYRGTLIVLVDSAGVPRSVMGADGPQRALTVAPEAAAEQLWDTDDGMAVLAGRAYCLVVTGNRDVIGIVTEPVLAALLPADPLERELTRAGDLSEPHRAEGDRRHVNLCFVWPHSRNSLPLHTCLQTGRGYEVRIDIGELSAQSIVINPRRFPADLLPPTEEGSWLEIVLASDDFRLPRSSFPLFLPHHGPSWVCDCAAGSRHSCQPRQRGTYLYIPVLVPSEPGIGRLRLTVCVDNNQIQSMLVTVEIADSERAGMTQQAVIDYTLTDSLSDVQALPSPLLSIGLSPIAAERQSMLVRTREDGPVIISLSELQMNAMLARGRNLLDRIQKGLDGRTLRADPRRFQQDLMNLAIFGRGLFTRVVPDRATRAALGSRLRHCGVIQVARAGNSAYLIPWALLYDMPIQDGDPSQNRFCPVIDAWDALETSDGTLVQGCPYEAGHATNTVCPFGFWGFRHIIETPPSMPPGRSLPTRIRTPPAPKMVVGYGKLRQAQAHVGVLRTELAGIELHVHDQREELITTLRSLDLSLVYFFCHCHPGDDHVVPGPYLEIGKERITPNDLATDDLEPLEYWRRNSPLVFVNGCQTAGITLDSWIDFISVFAQMYASGVIGTDIPIRETLASKVAEYFWASLNKRCTVGESLHALRLRLLRDNNLLGLAYSAYCSAHLRLDQ